MKFSVFATFSLLASIVNAFHVVPPSSIVACSSLTVEYDTRTGQPPFSLSFHTNSADGPIVAAFTGISGTSFTWNTVPIFAGTNVVIVLSDANGLGSATPVITVSPGPNDVCLDTPTPIPSLPPLTSTSPPTSVFSGSPALSSSLSTTMVSSSPTSSSSGLTSSLSSLSSLISSASSQISSLTETTSSPRSTPTGGLGTSGAVVNTASLIGIGSIAAVVGALLA